MKHLSFYSTRGRAACMVLFLAACLLTLADAGASQGPAATPDRSPIRSAQLFARDGGWQSVVPTSPQEERREIRAHFGAVGQLLVQDRVTSLDIAVARFEEAFQLSLTPAGRAGLRDRLAARREVQLERLRDYAQAGSFPLNRHYADEARPIFVDARGTHCAVGHLMALDGWENDVQAIARARPNVLVRDVRDGPLVAWVLMSGLIQEEAALIQPAYFPPSTASATKLSDLIVPGASLEQNGFRYENFAFSATSTGGAATPTAAQLGLVYGWPPVATAGGFCPGSPGCVPRTDTFWFGIVASPTSFGGLSTAPNQSISIQIDYDVVAIAAGLAIGGTTSFVSSLYGGFSLGLGTNTLATTLDGDPLQTLALEISQFRTDASARILLSAPANRLHLRHTVQVANRGVFSSFDSEILRATAVPAPGTLGLLALSLAMLGRYRLRREQTPLPHHRRH